MRKISCYSRNTIFICNIVMAQNTNSAKKRKNSLAGNRTPVSCVTDRDTHHYTTKDCMNDNENYSLYIYKVQTEHLQLVF